MEWRKCLSKSTGKPYYYNVRTKESTYERPPGFVTPPREPDRGHAADRRRRGRDDEDEDERNNAEHVHGSSTIYTNAAIGNVGNLLLLTCTLVITTCMLYQLPSPDYFDSHWLHAGFCVTASHTIWRNSHLLSFYADTALAAVLYYMYQNAPRKTKQNELQLELLRGSISGVFFHGLGHMYVGFQPMGMDLRWNPSEDLVRSVASTIVTVGTFFSIFDSTMPFASVKQLILTSVIATAGFTVMDLEPKLNFIYAQAAIYVFAALHMLLRLNEVHKKSKIYAM